MGPHAATSDSTAGWREQTAPALPLPVQPTAPPSRRIPTPGRAERCQCDTISFIPTCGGPAPRPLKAAPARIVRVTPREVGMANLKEGSSGAEVTRLQQRL